MKSVLHIGAVIDSQTPAAWVNQLLQKIELHDNMRLVVGVHDKLTLTDAEPAAKRRTGLSDWLLENVIDIPQFSHDPWQPESLSEPISCKNLTQHPDALDDCDLILYLVNHTPPSSITQGKTPVWSADLPGMDCRIRHSLLNRTPFIWIHLWNVQDNADSQRIVNDRIASHALPCQTYSISDLRRSAYSALPNVFMSRLIWLTCKTDHTLDNIDAQSVDQGVFTTDLQHAAIDAQTTDSGNTGAGLRSRFLPLWHTGKLLMQQLYERLHHRLLVERWQLAVSEFPQAETADLKDIMQMPLHTFTGIAESRDVMWADPHLSEYRGDTYVFFEKKYRHKENAHIAYAKLGKKGEILDSGVALANEHHLSFPHVFTHADNHYMIPETASLKNVSLYKAIRFPDQWECQQELLSDINAADTVLLEHEGRWWMFTNCQSHQTVDERDELHIYFADKLEGPWQAHAMNPVLTGVDRSRMAGPILHDNGNLYRCSQYGAYRYGYGVNFSRIVELTPQNYRESAGWRLLPEPRSGWSGCHSFGRLGNLAIIDRVRFSLW